MKVCLEKLFTEKQNSIKHKPPSSCCKQKCQLNWYETCIITQTHRQVIHVQTLVEQVDTQSISVCMHMCVCERERESMRRLRKQKNLANVIPLRRYKREQSQSSAHTKGFSAACSYPLDGWLVPCTWIIQQQQQACLPLA